VKECANGVRKKETVFTVGKDGRTHREFKAKTKGGGRVKYGDTPKGGTAGLAPQCKKKNYKRAMPDERKTSGYWAQTQRRETEKITNETRRVPAKSHGGHDRLRKICIQATLARSSEKSGGDQKKRGKKR